MKLFELHSFAVIAEAFNDDDFYLLDANTKKVIKNIGAKRPGYVFRDNPEKDPVLSKYVTDPKSQIILSGMRAKSRGYTE
jgi:hypothetical protein